MNSPSEPGASPRRIVAAVDGSPTSRLALRRADEEARAHSGQLEVLHAWNFLEQPVESPFDAHFDAAAAESELRALLEEELGGRAGDATVNLVNDLPARAILEAAEGAWLVVVGSRGLGGFKGLLLGSVSQQVVHHATCPVLVVPSPERTTIRASAVTAD